MQKNELVNHCYKMSGSSDPYEMETTLVGDENPLSYAANYGQKKAQLKSWAKSLFGNTHKLKHTLDMTGSYAIKFTYKCKKNKLFHYRYESVVE